MAFNPVQKLRNNIDAISLALDWDDRQQFNEAQALVLKNYAGFGGLKAVLYPKGTIEEWRKLNASEADLRLYPLVMELHKVLEGKLSEKQYKEAVDSMRQSILTAFYTPSFVPQALYAALREQNIFPRHLYEPSAGAGVFVAEAFNSFDGLTASAVEKDLLTGKVLQAYMKTQIR